MKKPKLYSISILGENTIGNTKMAMLTINATTGNIRETCLNKTTKLRHKCDYLFAYIKQVLNQSQLNAMSFYLL